MNKCKAAYCRIFQKCFKIAIPFLPYRHPEVFYSTSKLTGLFAEKGIDTVLIITDAGIRKFGLLDRMLMHFDHHNIHYFIYDKTVANPTTTNVEEARELYLENIVMLSLVLVVAPVSTVPRPSVQESQNLSSLYPK